MFKINFWYSLEGVEKNTSEKQLQGVVIAEKTMIDVDNLNITYQDIIVTFVLNTVLHHVGMLWIIETRGQLQYDMDKHNS